MQRANAMTVGCKPTMQAIGNITGLRGSSHVKFKIDQGPVARALNALTHFS